MREISIGFDMTDALIVQAAREDCIAVAREFVSLRDVLIILASGVVFALAVTGDSHWLWWIAGLGPVYFGILGLGWVVAYLWIPSVAKKRLAHLPNRHIQIEMSDPALSFRTATERLEVAWTELKALRRRPSFWLVCLRSGPRIPIPAVVLTDDALALLEAKLATSGKRKHDAG